MILIIDNYDSFTYNLVQRLGELDAGLDVRVYRNDQITPDEVAPLAPSHIIISPGPCTPREAGVSNEVLRRYAPATPVLGVCLGHQCIGQAFGGDVTGAGEIKHGKLSSIRHDGKGVFAGLPNPFDAIRYHSLAVNPKRVPDCLEVSATSETGDRLTGLRPVFELEYDVSYLLDSEFE